MLGFARDWEDYKTQARGIDYTDMIEIALREGLVPGNYAAAFIDEAQDLSKLELSYVRFLGASMDYFTLLSDPNQTLYHFKGATPNAFLDANLPKENVRVLGQSHRVPRAIHRRAAAWQLLPLEYKARDYEGEVKQAFVNCTDFELFDLPLKRQLEDGKTVMLLTSAAYMLTPILNELRAAAVPFHNPYRPTAAEWNPLLADKPHKPVHRLLNFFRAEPDFWGDAARTPTNEELWNAMQYLGKSAYRFGAKAVLEALARDRFRQKDTADVDDLVAPGLLSGTLVERAERYAALQWDKLQDETFYLARVIRKYGPGVLKEKPQTIVGTIHSVKGGEAEIVYLFPELSPSALRAWYVDGEERDAIIRTYYVGLTRARESVFLCELHKDGVDFAEHHAKAAMVG